MTAFSDVASLPGAPIFACIELSARDRDTGAALQYYVTTAPRFFTTGSDTPENTPFLSVVVDEWSTDRRIGTRGSFGGTSVVDTANIVVGGAKELDGWLEHDWNGHDVTIKLGAHHKADGSAFAYSDFETAFAGVVDDVVSLGEGRLEVRIRGRSEDFQAPYIKDQFTGFGGALICDGTEDSVGRIDGNPAITLDGGMTLEWFGIIRAAATSVRAGIAVRFNHFGLMVLPNGELSLYAGRSSTSDPNLYVSTGYRVPFGEPQFLAWSSDGSATAKIYAGRSSMDYGLVAEVEMQSPIRASADGSFYVGRGFSDNSELTADTWELRLWGDERTAEELQRNLGPLTSPDYYEMNENLTQLWKFGDGTGSVARTSLENGLDIDLLGSARFYASRDGDDPEQFNGTLVGQSKPRVWGEARNVPLVSVDTQFGHYMISDMPCPILGEVRARGAPLSPIERTTAAAAGDFVAGSNFIEFVGLDIGERIGLRRFVAGQPYPQVDGQRMLISGWPGNDGIYRIADNGITASAIRLRNEDGTASAVLTPGPCPAGARFGTPPGEGYYSAELGAGTESASFGQGPTIIRTAVNDDMTADVTGIVAEEGLNRIRGREIIYDLLDGELIDDQALGPEVRDLRMALVERVGEARTLSDLLDEVCGSFLGWWVEGRVSGYRIGNFSPPSADADLAAVISTTPAMRLTTIPSDFDGAYGSILSVTPIATEVPAWRIRATYEKNHSVSAPEALVGAVSPAKRRLYSEPNLVAIRTNPGILERWPNAREIEIDTLMDSRSHTEFFLDAAEDLYSTPRQFFELEVAGLPPLSVDLNDTILIEDPDALNHLRGGVRARVIRIRERLEGLTDIECYT